MEYVNISGNIELLPDSDGKVVNNEILDQLNDTEFVGGDGVVSSTIFKNRVWVYAVGLVKKDESDRLIKIMNELNKCITKGSSIDFIRERLELHIVLGWSK